MQTSPRLPGYDLARALAVAGMVVVNFTSIMEVDVFAPAWLKPAVDFIYGRAAVVFVMLAGVSVSLMAGRRQGPDEVKSLQRRLLRRSLLLLIVGMALWHWWEADILHFYAVFIAAGAWALTLRLGHLRILTAMIFCVSLPVCAALTSAYDLGDPIFTAVPGWTGLRLLMDLVTSPNYALFPWLGFFFAGMLLGRRDQSRRSYYERLFLMGGATCLALEILCACLMNWIERVGMEIEGDWWITFIRSEAFPVTPLFVLSAGASAVALIGFCTMACDGPSRTFLGMTTLTAFGRLSLTMYMAHIGWAMLYKRWLAGPCTAISSHHMFLVAATFIMAGLLSTAVWCRYFNRGPLETLFHRLTSGAASRRDINLDRIPSLKT